MFGKRVKEGIAIWESRENISSSRQDGGSSESESGGSLSREKTRDWRSVRTTNERNESRTTTNIELYQKKVVEKKNFSKGI
jgi:hypothetical protein